MNPVTQVATPPAKPLLVFDGDCHFCSLWIKRWQQISGEAVDYAPFQSPEITTRFPEIPREQFATAVQLIQPSGLVLSGAHAALTALAQNCAWRWLLWLYGRVKPFAGFAEFSYQIVARHRPFFSKLTWLGWGKYTERPEHFHVRWIFLRGLALIYLTAFISLWVQIEGLVGSNGILPADKFMAGVSEQVKSANIGVERYRLLPTLCWFNASDSALHWQCAVGVTCAILLLFGIAPAPCLALLWLIYLSLSTVCREFLSFQWDILLLETGFLAILFAPSRLWPNRARELPPSLIVLWLLRLLLFKLMVQSGWVKLLSGDQLWLDYTALTVHYETQPLPTWIGWYAHQLPVWFQKLSCRAMFGIELVIPFLIFAPRRPRFLAAWLLMLLQVLILLTGNYTFFNWLTLLLCASLLDDFFLRHFASFFRHNLRQSKDEPRRLAPTSSLVRWRRLITVPLAMVIIAITCVQLLATFKQRPGILTPVVAIYQWIAPFRSLNSYGLFAVMTPSRPEIIVEGSNDGITWLPYEFKYKPGDLKRAPAFVAPHQPRLDWQMWFAALSRRQDNPWFGRFCRRLLEGSPEVLALLDRNPFPEKPPRFIRATLYHYRFTTFEERQRTGNWWRREKLREYLPAVSLQGRPGH
ncbi:MAG TPA: lipase maturation factor family protein [Verrucomicrobiae bacterium]|nr:lipase maturation factor family protein [Verrucomicrobiae bacterium]